MIRYLTCTPSNSCCSAAALSRKKDGDKVLSLLPAVDTGGGGACVCMCGSECVGVSEYVE